MYMTFFTPIKQTSFSLVPLRDVEKYDETGFAWKAIGDSPAFILSPDSGQFPCGWVLLSTEIKQYGSGHNARLCIESDDEDGAYWVDLPSTRKGEVNEIIHLPTSVRMIVLIPMTGNDDFELGTVTTRGVGPLSRRFQMLRRVISYSYKSTPDVRNTLDLTFLSTFSNLECSYRNAGRLYVNAPSITYDEWIQRFDTFGVKGKEFVARQIDERPYDARVNVVVISDGEMDALRETLESLSRQCYTAFCVSIVNATDASELNNQCLHKVVSEFSNGLAVAVFTNYSRSMSDFPYETYGSHTLFLSEGGALSEFAIYYMVSELQGGAADLVYWDEDEINPNGGRVSPAFKCSWNPDLFLSKDYLGCARLYRSDLLSSLGGNVDISLPELELKFILEVVGRGDESRVRHISAVLSHHRAIGKSTEGDEFDGFRAQLRREFFSSHSNVKVEEGAHKWEYRLRYPMPSPAPKVTLIIPSRDQIEHLRKCVSSICDKTTYPNWEILIVDNLSSEEGTLRFFDSVVGNPRINVVRYSRPFNYSAINNFAVECSDGELIALINNDVEVISPEWLSEMVSHALRPEIGAVGAKLYFGNGHIQHAGIVLGIGGVAGHSHKYFPGDSSGYMGMLDVVQNVSAVTGACMVVRRSLYEEVGGLDSDKLKVAYNDVDFCLKLQAAGYRNLWTPFAELYHHESVSRGSNDTWKKRRRLKNESLVMRKRWGEMLDNDMYYSPYLTLAREDLSLSWVPRHVHAWVNT